MPDSGRDHDQRPRIATPSRRRLLSAAAGCAALAGCARTVPDRGPTRVCGTGRVGDPDGSDLIESVDVTPGEAAVLVVRLRPGGEAFEALDRLLVFDADDTRRYPVPLDPAAGQEGPRRTYQQALGPFPQNGALRVEARDAEGSTLDSVALEFTCYAETPTAE